jgi:hypothetical protein
LLGEHRNSGEAPYQLLARFTALIVAALIEQDRRRDIAIAARETSPSSLTASAPTAVCVGIPNAVGEQPIQIGKVGIAVDEEIQPFAILLARPLAIPQSPWKCAQPSADQSSVLTKPDSTTVNAPRTISTLLSGQPACLPPRSFDSVAAE